LRTEVRGETLVVGFVDSNLVTEENTVEMGEALYDLVEACVQPSLLLNLGNVKYMSSGALKQLIDTKKLCARRKISLCLCSIHPDLYEVFLVTRLSQVFLITQDEEEALELLAGHLEIACPVYGCDGLARTTVALAKPSGETQCSRCFAVFTVTIGQPDMAGTFEAQVRSVRLQTYEHGHIEVFLDYRCCVEVVGPLDLFAAEQLQRAWLMLPPSRSVPIDLRGASELSQRGLEVLVALRTSEGEESGFAVILGEGQGDWVSRFPANFPVKVLPSGASWSPPPGSQVRLSIKGRSIGSRFAGPPGPH
jgi:anti-anti-sigma factor